MRDIPYVIQEIIQKDPQRHVRAVRVASEGMVLEYATGTDAMGNLLWLSNYERDPDQIEYDAKSIIIGMAEKLEKAVSGTFRIPEANVFVDDGRWSVTHQLTHYWVKPLRDPAGRRYLAVERALGTDRTVDLETRAQVLEKCLINLIQWTEP